MFDVFNCFIYFFIVDVVVDVFFILFCIYKFGKVEDVEVLWGNRLFKAKCVVDFVYVDFGVVVNEF